MFLGLLLLFDWAIEVIFSEDLIHNEYFEPIYMQVYLGLLGIYAVALGLYLAYLVSKDGPCSRCLVPFAVLLAALVNFAIVTWIIVYIYKYYKYDKVYVTTSYNEKQNKYDYEEWSKEKYVTLHVIEPFVVGFIFLCSTCLAFKWWINHKS